MAGQLAEALTLQRQRRAAQPGRRNGSCQWLILGEYGSNCRKASGRKLWEKNDTVKSVKQFKHESALVFRIHVSCRWNQQLASCRVTIFGSEMQSGALETRSENQMKISKHKT
jgi:hypothetical protein